MERRFLMNEECDPTPITWNFPLFALKIQKNDPNYASDKLQSGFFWPNYENSVEQSDPLDPALSSIVCSPAGSNAGSAVNSVGDKLMIRELSGRLVSCCEPGDILTQVYVGGNNESTNYSSCSTQLNSPPKFNLSVESPDIKGNSTFYERNFPIHPSSKPFCSDPEIAERAARFSRFDARNGILGKQISTIRDFESQIGDQERRTSSIEFRTSLPNKKSRKPSRSPTLDTVERGDSREVSSLFQQLSYCETAMKEKDEVDPNNRKRKSSSKVKSEEAPSGKIAKIEGKNDESNPDDETKTKKEANEGTKSGEDDDQKNAKLPEPPKDYIHVRARRGQATDSHSLAERVRREKISERMKFLQDLVPGCNKVTGKAVVLDEIINYVQSLQRQVECLSMKLASVNPRMNLNMAALLFKDISESSASLRHIADSSSAAFLNIPSETEIQFPGNSLNALLCRNQQMQMIHLDGYSKDDPQVLSCWEDGLQSLVQMGFGQNLQQNLHC